MNARILFNFVGAAILLAGCTASVPLEPSKTFKLAGHQVQFSPPAKFELKEEREAKGKPVVAVVFQTPSKLGHIAVNALDATNGTEYDKLDKKNLQPFADAVYKRSGRITAQREVDLLGGKGNGYRMEFEYGDGDTKMCGVQVHVPYQKVLYSIVMTVPAKELKDDLPWFEGVVNTFKVQ